MNTDHWLNHDWVRLLGQAPGIHLVLTISPLNLGTATTHAALEAGTWLRREARQLVHVQQLPRHKNRT